MVLRSGVPRECAGHRENEDPREYFAEASIGRGAACFYSSLIVGAQIDRFLGLIFFWSRSNATPLDRGASGMGGGKRLASARRDAPHRFSEDAL